ncbi:amino acid permease [Achromobacter aegrifaciens]|uniref:putative glutamine/gamma-aminobutyrate antiporter GadC n=1 Tax=Achromobacter aegrifaciens TaxID=1287736 RepID=UPI0027B98BC5|nr:putative glutamine/gamma-aminobutyrate antiporter GadC [Achromobacter aegrifaciens]WLW63574.1 amino acid permease [Achromobacter aegrifaciens]
MNIVAVVSLRGLPAEAEYGLSSVFYYLFAAVFFLIPVSLVAAELATGWSEKGGVFRWVGEAFGPRLAFLAMFMLWIEVTVWFPTALTFGAVSLAFIGPDQRWDEALSSNKFFILAIVLVIYWLATFIAFRGVDTFAKVSKWGGIIGTIIPAIILVVLGFSYLFAGNTPQIALAWNEVVPDFTNFDNVVLAASIFLFYAGMEMNAIHVQEVDNPKRNYPIAIMLSALGTVLIFVLGTLAIAFVIPQSDINLTQSLLVAYDDMFKWAGLSWLGPVVAVALAIGVLAGVVTWVAGPSSGLLVVAKAGYLPRWWQHTNAHGMATHILLLQAVIVSLLATLFVVLPSVQAVYQMLSQLTVILYLVMYLLMFAAAIYLRHSQPNQLRPYRIPGGNAGMWIIGGAGFIGSLLAFIFSFIPPSQISVGSPATYVEILVGLTAFFCILPFLIYMVRKPSWRDENSDFAPFTWQAPKASAAAPVTAASIAPARAAPGAPPPSNS